MSVLRELEVVLPVAIRTSVLQCRLGHDLVKHKDGILRERDRLNAEVEELNKRLQIQRIYTEEIEQKRAESEKKNKELYKSLDETSSEAYQKIRMVDMLKQDIADMEAERINMRAEAKTFQTQLDGMQTSLQQVNAKLTLSKANLEKCNGTLTHTNNKLATVTADLEQMAASRRKCQIELGQNATKLKLRDSECNKYLRENVQLVKYREQLQKKLVAMEHTKSDLMQEILKLR